MNKYGIYHMTDEPYAYANNFNELTLRVRTARDDIKKCVVYFKDKYYVDSNFEEKNMELVVKTELFDYFEVNISTFRNRYMYYFKLIDNEGNEEYLNERGLREECIDVYSYVFPYIAHEDVYEDVKWMQECIAYQIFPDRFCNGDDTISPEGVLPWGEGKVTHHSRYGGDLKGVINKLDYLEELGVDLIYLTPVFKSNTSHKYNTADYFNIDPEFGTVEVAKELVEKCHKKGMKIVLDAVFNHSGSDFFAFEDLLKNQENSKYKDWYFVDQYPVEFKKDKYYTFGDYHLNMPKLNTNNKELREYLLKVAEYWIKEVGIDGWRLDVCDEIGHDFWRDFRKTVKNARKDAIIVGEIMHEANTFLKGDQLDSIMNYPFKRALADFFATRCISSEEFSDILGQNRILYMNAVTKQMWNLIDSHDTLRFLSESNNNLQSMKLALAFQFAYVGVPYIYYGDEIGLDGNHDPENRKCMIWEKEKQNLELFELYKKLICIRKENKCLVHGKYKELYCKENVIAFERKTDEEGILVIINNNDNEKEIELNSVFKGINLLTGEEVSVNNKLNMEKMSCKIIKIC